MDTVTLQAKGISVSLDLAVGHIADMSVEAEGRRLKPLHRAPGLEAMLLVVLVTVASFTGFEIVRRVPLLRPLFGLGPRAPVAYPAATAVGSGAPA